MKRLFFILLFPLALTSCSGTHYASQPAVMIASTSQTITIYNAGSSSNSPGPLGFVQYKYNPVLASGSSPNPNVYSPYIIWSGSLGEYEMFYGGWDGTYTQGSQDWIYLAESADLLHWTKVKTILKTGTDYFDNKNVNDASVMDVPDWSMRLMMYTCAGTGYGTYNDFLCIATAPPGSDSFTEYPGNPVALPPTTSGYIARPALVSYSNGTVLFYYDYGDAYGGTDQIGYGLLSYSNGMFTAQAESDLPGNPLGINGTGGAQDTWESGNNYLMAAQVDQLWNSTDGMNWDYYGDYADFYNSPVLNSYGEVTPKFILDKNGLLKGIAYGLATTPGWDRNYICIMPLMRGVKILDSNGQIVPATYYALDYNTLEIDLPASVTLPIQGSLELFDESGKPIYTSPQITINSGSSFQIIGNTID